MIGQNHTVVSVETTGPLEYTHTYTKVFVRNERALMLDYELTPGQREHLERFIQNRLDRAFEEAVHDFTMSQPRVDMQNMRPWEMESVERMLPRHPYVA